MGGWWIVVGISGGDVFTNITEMLLPKTLSNALLVRAKLESLLEI